MTPGDDVVVVRTGIANTAAVVAAFGRLGMRARVTDDRPAVESASLLVLPGVGSFGAGARRLREAGLVEPLAARVRDGRPTLAICLGFQLLCASSEETPGERGLGVIDGEMTRYGEGARVPQLGWNGVVPEEGCALLREGFAYFANSFRLARAPAGWAVARADYAGPFIAAVERGAVLACQFHPEISGPWGLELIERWTSRARELASC